MCRYFGGEETLDNTLAPIKRRPQNPLPTQYITEYITVEYTVQYQYMYNTVQSTVQCSAVQGCIGCGNEGVLQRVCGRDTLAVELLSYGHTALSSSYQYNTDKPQVPHM